MAQNETVTVNVKVVGEDKLNKAMKTTSVSIEQLGADLGLMNSQMGSLFVGLIKGAQTASKAIGGIKSALIATGIGALVVAVGTIAVYWEDILGMINGVSVESQELLKTSEKLADAEKDRLDALEQSENVLKLSGKSEREIYQIKIEQIKLAIDAQQIAVETLKIQKQSELEAAQRNRNLIDGILKFATGGINILFRGIEELGNLFGKKWTLSTDFNKWIADFIVDPEEVKAEGEKAIKEEEKVLRQLVDKKASYELKIGEINKKGAAERKKTRDEELKEELAAILKLGQAAGNEPLVSNKFTRSIIEPGQTSPDKVVGYYNKFDFKTAKDIPGLWSEEFIARMKAGGQKVVDEYNKGWEEGEAKRLATSQKFRDDEFAWNLEQQKKTQDELLRQSEEYYIASLETDEERQLAKLDLDKQRFEEELQRKLDEGELLGTEVTDLKLNNEEIYFQKVVEIEDLITAKKKEEAEKQKAIERDKQRQIRAGVADTAMMVIQALTAVFGESKALSVAETLINTYQSASGAYLSMIEIPVAGPVLAPIAAAAAVVAGLANVQKIMQTNVSGSGSESSGFSRNKNPMALGGWIGGSSHQNGGVNINAEGGEYIVNKRTMSSGLGPLVIAANNYGNAPQNGMPGMDPNAIAQVVIQSIRNIPVTVVETDITVMQKKVQNRESKFVK